MASAIFTHYRLHVMHTLRHMWSIFRIHMGHTCGIYFLIDTLGAHTHSVCHGAHSHLHMLGTGRVHTYTLEACLCKFGHTWMHIKHNCTVTYV